MQLNVKTILNLKEKHSHFVYRDVRLIGAEEPRIEVKVEPRQGSKGNCSGCGDACPGYDRLPQREFIHVPLWGIAVILLYCMRRLACPTCGVTVEVVPWGSGKSPITTSYAWYLSEWAKLLSMQEVAMQFKISWHHVFSAMAMAVAWGRERMDLAGITAIGVDEIHWSTKQGFMTLVYQIDLGITRLLWVGKERTVESFRGFFTVIGDDLASKIVFVCSDMWQPYLKVIREKCSDALHILDRFHIVAKMNKALDEVRAEESGRIKREGQAPVLRKSRWLLLKHHRNLKNDQRFRLRDLLRYNLKTVRAYLLKEAFQQLWDYNSPAWAGKFLDEWCRQTMRSRIEPMKKIARSLRQHRELILNYFLAQKQLSSGVVEGLNNKAKLTMRKSYGFRTFRALELALYHSLGKLPEPESTHDFF
jgi:transposase